MMSTSSANWLPALEEQCAVLDDADDSEYSDTESVKNLNEQSESETDESENNEQQTEGSNFFVGKNKSTI